MNCPSKRLDCMHHKLFNNFVSLGVNEIKSHFYAFSSVIMDMYFKDDPGNCFEVPKNPNDLFCYLYMTKTNRIQHLNTVAGKYIFLRRPEDGTQPAWMLLLTFKPIPETRSFFYVGTDSFAACLYHVISHKQGINKEDELTYINLPYNLRMTVQLFLFAKTLDETLEYKILTMINNHLRRGNDSMFCLKSTAQLFDSRSFVDIQDVCKFDSMFDDCIISESLLCVNKKTSNTVKREEARKCLTMQHLLQMKFSTSYQPLLPEMNKNCAISVQAFLYSPPQTSLNQNSQIPRKFKIP